MKLIKKRNLTLRGREFFRTITALMLMVMLAGAQSQKIVSYFPSWSGMTELQKVPFSMLTHINYAFVQSDHSGNVIFTGWGSNEMGQLQEMIRLARENEVTVMVSVNGNTGTGTHTIIQDGNDALRNQFAQNIVAFMKEWELDGIDLDIESLNEVTISVRMNYGKLAAEIRRLLDLESAVKGTPYYLSAAVGWQCDAAKEWFSDEFVASMDWLNPMVYDASGWWGAESFTNHAPYQYFIASGTTEWPTRLAKDKIVLGVPFYGYTHETRTSPNGEQIAYRDILVRYPNQQPDDTLAGNDQEGYIIYDGPDQIRKKAEFVKSEGLGGIMIWHLAQDVYDDRSLLKIVSAVINDGTAAKGFESNKAYNGITTCSAGNTIRIVIEKADTYAMNIYNLQGKLITPLYKGFLNPRTTILPVGKNYMASGPYVLHIQRGRNTHVSLLKQPER